jgi:uncharacterized repeat protein (TIGR03803 family)
MKKHILFSLLCILSSSILTVSAQTMGNLWATLPYGGDSAGGVLFNYNPNTGQNNIAYPFFADGQEPVYSNLIQATDGNFYGMTSYGGENDWGAIIKYTPSGQISVIHSFSVSPVDGLYPNGSLIQGKDGNLYGMTSAGGLYQEGTIFKCSLTGAFTLLYSFTGGGSDGAFPDGGLVQANNGTLYGMTFKGGPLNGGIIFKCSTSGTETILHNFTGGITDGAAPYGSLIFANDSNLYGMTDSGGSSGFGSIIKCDTLGNESVLYSFGGGGDGNYPYGDLIQASNDTLYGMTSSGGSNSYWGCIFKCSLSGTESVIYSFTGGFDGGNPFGNVIQANDGNLYAMTEYGGTNGNGALIKCTTTGTESVLYSFGNNANDGSWPYSSLVQANDGKLYGMIIGGGLANRGAIFNCTLAGTETVLHDFASDAVGNTSAGNLIQTKDGYLYGVTDYGGIYGYGTIFKRSPSGAITTLHNFTGTTSDGAYPVSSLIQASDSNLYGTTLNGGATNTGTIFECTTGGTFTLLHSFSGGPFDGIFPYGTLVQDSTRALYGTTGYGGNTDSGVIFKYTLSGTFSVIHTFSASPNDGGNPYCGLIRGKDGMLYGVTYAGGANDSGTVFKSDTLGNLTVLHSFAGGIDGAQPYSTVTQANDGNLYGMTSKGGPAGGTIFKCSTTGIESIIHNFLGSPSDGQAPQGGLIQASDGNLYGMTSSGGTYNFGTLFKCTTAGAETVLLNFNDTVNGSDPDFNTPLEAMGVNIIASTNCSSYSLTASVGGGGPGLYTYHWSNGSTNDTINNITAAGTYSVTAKNVAGIMVSASITLPAFTTLGASINSSTDPCSGNNNGTATVTASGGLAPYTYLWSDANTQTVMTATGLSAGSYNVTVRDVGGCIATAGVTLTAVAAPSINTQPSTTPQTGCPGFSATALSIAATGTGLNYQWYSNTANSNSGGNTIGGATNTNYTPATVVSGTLYYYCIVNGTGGCTTTSNVSGAVTTDSSPAITVQPTTATQNGCPGFSANVSVTATGDGLTYQWYSNTVNSNSGGTLITGGNSDNYSPVTTTPGNLYYYCVVSGTCTPVVTSNVSGLVKVDSLPAITVQPSSTPQTGCSGFAANALSVAATGTAITYQWYASTSNSNVGGTAINNATSNNYTPLTTALGTLYYYCVVSGTCTPAITSNVSGAVNVATPDTAVMQIGDTLKAHATGVTYQWLDCDNDSSIITGATSQKFMVSTNGHYAVVIAQNGCSDTSYCHYVNVTGVNNISSLAANVSIYPLPNNGHFAVSMNGTGYKYITIYDEMGKVVFTQPLQDESANSTLNVNMSNYADGIYFAQIITNGGTINKKVIIQK